MMPGEKKGQCQGIPRPALDSMLHCMDAAWVVYGAAFFLCSGRCLQEHRICSVRLVCVIRLQKSWSHN